MKQFIKLSSRVINKSHIIEIIKNQNMYEIYLTNIRINGSLVMSYGDISTKQKIITIYEKHDNEDYETIKKFIAEIE